MLKSQLAIVDDRGLRNISDDSATAYDSLNRQFDDIKCTPSVLIWTVISEEALSHVRHHLRRGDGHMAWSLLQSRADQIGTLRATSSPALTGLND